MQLIKHFMADNAARSALNALTRATFGFSFESWYAAGWWAGDYLPYAFEEDGRLLSNVSSSARLYLLGCRQENGVTELQFGYQINGLPIRFSDGSCAAEVTLTGTSVTRLSLRMR